MIVSRCTTLQIRLELVNQYLVDELGLGPRFIGDSPAKGRRAVGVVGNIVRIVRLGAVTTLHYSAATATSQRSTRYHLDLYTAVSTVTFCISSGLVAFFPLFATPPDEWAEPEFLVIARVVFVLVALLGGGYGRSLRALLLVQGPRAIIVLRGTFLVALLTALLVEPQREALSEFLQHALLLALHAMRSILTSAGGHIGNIQDGRRLLQPGMADQRNRRLGQGMLGRHVASSRRIILFVAGPLSAIMVPI